MIISYNTLLPIDKAHAVAVDIGIAINAIPVRNNLIELDVVAIITNVSNDFNIVVIVLYFYISLLFFYFFFDAGYHFFLVTDMVLKTINIFFFSLVFVQDQYFLMVLLGIIYLFSGPFIWLKLLLFVYLYCKFILLYV